MVNLRRKTYSKNWRWYTTLVKVFIIVFTIIFLLIGAAIIIINVVEDEKAEIIISYLFISVILIINSVVIIYGFGFFIKKEIENWRKRKSDKHKKDWLEEAISTFSLDGSIFADDEERLKVCDMIEDYLKQLPESFSTKHLWDLIDTTRYNIRKKRKKLNNETSK
ncbi:MAG: hypothetical protein ACXAAH_13540 [Promethearchaeota archaeon]|jgi:hypothetical protein